MRSLALVPLLALAPMSACGRDPAAPDTPAPPVHRATSQAVVTLFDFDIPAWYLDCLGEAVRWQGQAEFTDHMVTRPDGSITGNGKGVVLPGSTMTGATSGTWIEPKTMNSYTGDIVTFSEVRLTERIRWTNQATGVLMDVWTVAHIVVAGNGELKLAVSEGPTCTLRG